MKVKYKLTLFLVFFSLILIGILQVNHYISNSSTQMYLENQTQKLSRACRNSISISNSQIKAVVFDYTFWDEFYEYIAQPDSSWEEANLWAVVSSTYGDYSWTYNLDGKNICSTQKEGYAKIKDPVPVETLFQLLDTAQNSTKRFTQFYIKKDSMYLVVCGATIHRTKDPKRLQTPSGMFLLGKVIDSTYINKLAVITNSQVTLLTDSLAAAPKGENTISTKQHFYDGGQKYLATLFFSQEDSYIVQNKAYQQRALTYVSCALGLMLVLIVILFNQVLTRPFNSIIKSLDNNNVDSVKKYLAKNNEFGKISRLIDQYIVQKNELHNEIEERTQIMRQLEKSNETLEKQNTEINELYNDNVSANEELRQQNEEITALNEHISEQMAIVQKAENRLKSIIDNQGEGFAIIDLEERITFANPIVYDIFDKQNSQILNCDLKGFFDEQQGQRIKKQTQQSKKESKGSFMLTMQSPKTNRHILLSCAPDYDLHRKITGTIVVFRDMTAQMKKQEKIKELNRTLHKYYKAIEENPISIAFTDTEAKVEYLNPSLTKLTGYTKTDQIGQKHFIMQNQNQDPKALKELMDAVANGRLWFGETTEYKKDGTPFIAKSTVVPIRDADGDINSYVTLIEDITKARMAEEELRNQNLIIEKAHNEIVSSINYARSIQRLLLTNAELIDSYLPNNFVAYLPKDNVSGDFYYVNKIGGHIIIAVADCTGHGVAGSFLTILGITYLHEIVKNRQAIDPTVYLSLLRERFKHTFESFGSRSTVGLNIGLCVYTPETMHLQFAGAYHPLWIVRKQQLIEIKATKSPIGYYPKEKEYVKHEVELQKGDQVYMFSDGFADQFGGAKNRKYKISNFRELLLNTCHLPMEVQKNKLLEAFEAWKGDCPQTDDVLLMGFKID